MKYTVNLKVSAHEYVVAKPYEVSGETKSPRKP